MWGHRQEELEVQGGWGEGRREGGSRGGPAASGWGCSVGRKVLMEGSAPCPASRTWESPLWGFQGDPLFLPVHGGLMVSGDWSGPSPGRMGREGQAHLPSCREEGRRASVGSVL